MTLDSLAAGSPAESRRSLAELVFSPDSVGFIGASDNPSKLIGYRPIAYLKSFGYRGSIYPVNPNREMIQGLPAYSSIGTTPQAPELVVVALPRQHVLAALEECAAAGARIVVVYSSGFSEVGDGVELHRRLTAFSARTGVRVIGPNCQGIANLATGFLPSFSTAFSGSDLSVGRTAVISQSGAMAGMIYNEWAAVGGGVGYWASTGNEADVTVGELGAAVIELDDVDCVFLYLESVRRVDQLELLAHRAEELGKDVVVFRPAQTSRGWRAASRHTGAGVIAGDDAHTRVPRGSRVREVHSIDQLIALGQLVRSGKRPDGRRVGILSNSGGLGVATADAAVKTGFTIGRLAPETESALGAVLPGFASVENPVDVTAQLLNDPALLSTALPAMLRDDEVDAIIVSLGAVGDGYDIDQIVRDVVIAHRESTKVIVVVWIGSRVDVGGALGSEGVPVYARIEDAVLALRAYAASPPEPCTTAGPPSPWFDDLTIGVEYATGPLSITADDLEAYGRAARQTGDRTNVHVDVGAAIAAGFDRRVVSGLHTLTAITVLGESIGLWRHSRVVAGFDDVRFVKPVLEEDAVSLRLIVSARKHLRGARGLVSFAFRLSDEQDATVASGTVSYVFERRAD